MGGMSYEDARDFMRAEADPDYIAPTFAWTGPEWDEACDSHGEDVMLEVMERDMARYETQRAERDAARIAALTDMLEEMGVEVDF